MDGDSDRAVRRAQRCGERCAREVAIREHDNDHRPGDGDHGTTMLKGDLDLGRALVDWFERTLL